MIVPCHDFYGAEPGETHSGENPCGDGGGETDVHQPQSGKERRKQQTERKKFQTFPVFGGFLNQNGWFHEHPAFCCVFPVQVWNCPRAIPVSSAWNIRVEFPVPWPRKGRAHNSDISEELPSSFRLSPFSLRSSMFRAIL